jgi:hypothetical protein
MCESIRGIIWFCHTNENTDICDCPDIRRGELPSKENDQSITMNPGIGKTSKQKNWA